MRGLWHVCAEMAADRAPELKNMIDRYFKASSLLAIALIGCAGSRLVLPPTALPPAVPPPENSCTYRNVWVDTNDASDGPISVFSEKTRREGMLRAISSLDSNEFWRVKNREDAYWSFRISAWTDRYGNTNLILSLAPELKLARHIFIVMIDDPTFPFSGDLGAGWKIVFSGRDLRKMNSSVDDGIRSISRRESEHLKALCSARERLVREGLSDIEELREQLVEEMRRLRRMRAADQQRHLHLAVEPDSEASEN